MFNRRVSLLMKKAGACWVICFIALFATACSHGSGSKAAHLQGEKLVFHRVAVAPFQQTTPEMVDINAVDCSSCGVFSQTERFPGQPEKWIEQRFIAGLKANYQIHVIPPERVSGMYERYANVLGQEKPLSVMKKVGADLEADGVIYGYVYHYRERKGLTYAVEKPASVAFEIHMFRVSDGALIWKGRFDKTQTSLVEDVLQAPSFLKGGGKWVTAQELADEGIESMIKNFPALPR